METTGNFKGQADTGEEVTICQHSGNGLYGVQLKDVDGSISALTCRVMSEVWIWLYEHKISSVNWEER